MENIHGNNAKAKVVHSIPDSTSTMNNHSSDIQSSDIQYTSQIKNSSSNTTGILRRNSRRKRSSRKFSLRLPFLQFFSSTTAIRQSRSKSSSHEELSKITQSEAECKTRDSSIDTINNNVLVSNVQNELDPIMLKTLESPKQKSFNNNKNTSSHYRANSYSDSNYDSNISLARNIAYDKNNINQLIDNAKDLSLTRASRRTTTMPMFKQHSHYHRALGIPEILQIIFHYVDELNTIPFEVAPKRRKPMSLRHALLVHGDRQVARDAWEKVQLEQTKPYDGIAQRSNSVGKNSSGLDNVLPAGLYSCLLVNSLWYQVGAEILYKKLYFKSDYNWIKFSELNLNYQTKENTDTSGLIINNSSKIVIRPSLLVLHKITDAQQVDIDRLGSQIGGNIKWLEFYTCPNIVPTRALMSGSKLTKLVLPGCNNVTDRTVSLIAECCHELEHLDLRACELVSDRGLKAIARNCRRLRLLNVGRTQRGELITYRGVKHIVRSTNIDTLGLAGCHIDDRVIWDIALYRGNRIERLSLNNCTLLTNASIPRVLGYTRNLSVLELRGCVQITDMRPIIMFKRYRESITGKIPLIEGCELFELRMKEAEWLLEMDISRQIFKDCLEWIYAADDDVVYK